jgi:hypothetical protein
MLGKFDDSYVLEHFHGISPERPTGFLPGHVVEATKASAAQQLASPLPPSHWRAERWRNAQRERRSGR